MKAATQRVTIWIDSEIAQQAKAKAVANRVTLSGVVEDLLYSYLKSMRDARQYARQLHNGKK